MRDASSEPQEPEAPVGPRPQGRWRESLGFARRDSHESPPRSAVETNCAAPERAEGRLQVNPALARRSFGPFRWSAAEPELERVRATGSVRRDGLHLEEARAEAAEGPLPVGTAHRPGTGLGLDPFEEVTGLLPPLHSLFAPGFRGPAREEEGRHRRRRGIPVPVDLALDDPRGCGVGTGGRRRADRRLRGGGRRGSRRHRGRKRRLRRGTSTLPAEEGPRRDSRRRDKCEDAESPPSHGFHDALERRRVHRGGRGFTENSESEPGSGPKQEEPGPDPVAHAQAEPERQNRGLTPSACGAGRQNRGLTLSRTPQEEPGPDPGVDVNPPLGRPLTAPGDASFPGGGFMRTWAAAAFILSLHLGLCTTRGARAEDGPAAPMAPRPAESEIVSHLEALVASEEGAAAEYKALGKAEEAAKASRRARTAREQLDDMKCGLRGPLPDRRSPVEVVLEQRHPRYLTNGGPDPVERLLEFLGPLQEADGRWDGGDDDADVEVTSLALIALLGQGETHRSREFGPRVRAAFAFLVEAQDADGLVGSRKGNRVPFRQAAASLALVRACRFSASPVFLKPAWSAVSACLGLRIPGKGWGRGPGATAEDPAATGWMALVLEDARRARLAECLDARVAALRCFERFTEAATGAVRTPAEADATVPASSQGTRSRRKPWRDAWLGSPVRIPLRPCSSLS